MERKIKMNLQKLKLFIERLRKLLLNCRILVRKKMKNEKLGDAK